MSRPQHVLIAGAGHAGGRVAQALRNQGYGGRITLAGDEAHPPYERPALSKELLLGRVAAALTLSPAEFWDGNDPALVRIHTAVQAVDGERRCARLSDGTMLSFDALVVATGGRPRRLRIPGGDLPGVHLLRTLDDSLALQRALRPGARVVVVGGGVIGLEVAAAARTLSLDVTVLEAGDRVMARSLPPEGSAWLSTLHRSRGVRLSTAAAVTQVSRLDDRTLAVHAASAQSGAAVYPADVVLAAIGIEPCVDFLVGSGVELDNGVRTDACGRSVSAPWCFAVGDVACSDSPVYGRPLRQETWRNAENQARIVAGAVLGGDTPHDEVPWMWTDQYDHNIQVVGLWSPGDVVITRGMSASAGVMLWLHGDRIGGGMLLNCGRERKALESLVRRQARVDPDVLANVDVPLKAMA